MLLPDSATILLAASFFGLVKQIALVVLAVLNGVLTVLATLAVWKSYLLTGAKVALTALVLIPVVGIAVYMFWGQKKVGNAA